MRGDAPHTLAFIVSSVFKVLLAAVAHEPDSRMNRSEVQAAGLAPEALFPAITIRNEPCAVRA